MDSNISLQLNNYIRKHSQQIGELYNAVNIISSRLVDLEKQGEVNKSDTKNMKLKLNSIQETFDSLDIEETQDECVEDNNELDDELVNETDNNDTCNNDVGNNDVREVITETKKRGRKKKQ